MIRQRDGTEAELLRQKAYLDELFELAPAAIVLAQLQPPRVVRVNREFCRMFGFSAEEVVGTNLRELIAPGDLDTGFTQNADAIAAGRNPEIEVVRQRKDGSRFPAHLTAATIQLSDGAPAAYLIYRDITAQKQAEAELERSEQRYSLAMQAAEDGHWDWIIETDEFYVSPRMLEICGFPADAVFKGRDDFVAQFPFHPEDKPKWETAAADHFAGRTARFEMELRMLRHGELRWIKLHGLVSRDASGKPVRWTGSVRDVTERRAMEVALRLSEERYAIVMEASGAGHWDWNIATDEYYASPRHLELAGHAPDFTWASRAEYVAAIAFHPEDKARWEAAVAAHFAGRSARFDIEVRLIPRGEVRWLHMTGMCIRDPSGAPVRWVGSMIDVTERKCIEEALQLSEQRYALAMEAAGDGHTDWIIATDQFYASPRALEIAGLPRGTTFAGRADWIARFPFFPQDRAAWLREVEEHFAHGSSRFEMEVRILARGALRWVHLVAMCSRDADGTPVRWSSSISDVTERKLAGDALRESEARFRSLTAISSDWYWKQDEDFRFTYLSNEVLDLAGYSPQSSIAKTRWELANIAPLSSSWLEHQAVLEAHQPFRDFEYSRVGPDGLPRYISVSGAPLFDEHGRFKGYHGVGRNITERKSIEAELRSRQDMLDIAQKAARAVAFEWRVGVGQGQNLWSPDLDAMYGIAPGSYDGTFESWKKLLHPDDWPAVKAAIKHAAESGDVAAEYRVIHPDGAVRWLQAKGRMFFNAERQPLRVVGFMLDVTERRKSEEDMGHLERQLVQAQRLEALGTLAGGIAHDFNNILGAILGFGEMALRDVPPGSRLRRDIDSLMTAGERGRSLVERILAFSRSGMGERVAVEVEAVVREALAMLAGSLPENIRVEANLDAPRAAMLGDASQVHQLLMNLATNAVQAMGSGGTLRVALAAETVEQARNASIGVLEPREYIVLTVADSGCGIAPDVLDRIFDPFFTLKEVGVGTGLGLSLVHGIVTEVGGAIEVASAVGEGSRFVVYLPRHGDTDGDTEPATAEMPQGHSQRVLVVDDEGPLVEIATRTLEELGYLPTGFTSSLDALAAFRERPGDFDALLTDERMPGLSGTELIREVRQIRESLPIVMMSGYLSAAALDGADGARADAVLRKPVSARDLAGSLARVLA